MPRFLLCWEFGGGLGHAGRFKALAAELLQRGHQVDVMLRDVVHTHALLKDVGVRTLQSPLWTHQTVGMPNPTVSLAEILMGNGYLQADALDGLVSGWLGAMELTRPDVVVADYAPTATIAARILGIPVATVGNGFCLPPDAAPIPPFRTWEPIQAGRVEHYDQLVLGSVNSVLAAHSAPPFDQLAEVLRGDLPLLCTWPELDPYRRGALPSGEDYLGPTFLPSGAAAAGAVTWPATSAPKVFAYLRSAHPDHAALLQALAESGCHTLCYLPEVAAGKAAPVESPRIHYAAGPVPLGQALPGCQLVICHAGDATIAQALLAGIPLLLLPLQAEQYLTACRVEEAGCGFNAASRPRPTPFKVMLDELLNKPEHQRHAEALAQRYQGFTHEAQTCRLVDAFESLSGRT